MTMMNDNDDDDCSVIREVWFKTCVAMKFVDHDDDDDDDDNSSSTTLATS